MTFDEFLRAEGRGAKTKIHEATKVSYPTLRKIERRLPVTLEVAFKVAGFLKCDPHALAKPKARKRLAQRKRAKEVRA